MIFEEKHYWLVWSFVDLDKFMSSAKNYNNVTLKVMQKKIYGKKRAQNLLFFLLRSFKTRAIVNIAAIATTIVCKKYWKSVKIASATKRSSQNVPSKAHIKNFFIL